jgi:hypothetical protein
VDIDEAMFNAVLAEQQKPSGPPEGEPLDAVSLTTLLPGPGNGAVR